MALGVADFEWYWFFDPYVFWNIGFGGVRIEM